ncbi:hypothetical protein OsI_36268 [Oryza sativa Indica Group]|uniref:Uncharacterized protein n=1 Tax=Oryza sativa subsp. indica TaxID=39946 RepID=B8BKR2_ORYSI|nr:hypothetical protein OsI_36268 [Oryza sativa Indica Group]
MKIGTLTIVSSFISYEELPISNNATGMWKSSRWNHYTWVVRMKKGLHPQMQWISYVTQSGRLINIMMTKVNHTGKVYHMRAKRQMAQSLGQIAKFNRRYQQESEENKEP